MNIKVFHKVSVFAFLINRWRINSWLMQLLGIGKKKGGGDAQGEVVGQSTIERREGGPM